MTAQQETQNRLNQLLSMRRSGYVDPFVVDYLDGLIAESQEFLRKKNGLIGSTR